MRRKSLGVGLTLIALFMGMLGLSQSASAAPAAPTSCSATMQSNGVLVEWTHPATNLTGAHIREYGFSTPLVKLTDGNVRSYLWTDPLRKAESNFAVRVTDATGYSAACITNKVSGTVEPEPSPSPTPEPTPEPTPTEEPPPPSDGSLPYTADSFFKSRVDVAGVPINQTRTQQFHNFMATHPDQGGKGIDWPKINVNENWAMSYYVHHPGESAPIWRLKDKAGNDLTGKHAILSTQGFHMADSVADTFPDGTQDRPGVMIDYEFGYTAQFADAVPNKTTRIITVTGPGIMWHSSNGLDYRNPKSTDVRNHTSRGRILDAMIVRRDMLDKAVQNGTGLGHVLHLFFVETSTADGVVHPMVGAESQKNGWGAEGERIRLKQDVNLEARGLTGHALALARTFKEHGAYLGDNSGSATQIKASQPHVYVGTNITTDAFKGKLFWTDFEVVEQGWQ